MASHNEHERRVVAGLFESTGQAERAVRELQAAGFDDDDIGLATRDRAEREALDAETGVRTSESAGGVMGGGGGGFLDKIASWLDAGSTDDDLSRAFTSQGFSEAEARHFDEGFRNGGILCTVRTHGREDAAWEVLRSCGADLGPMHGAGLAGASGIGASGTSTSGTSTSGMGASGMGRANLGAADLTEAQRLQLREEELRVAKEQVQTGEVRIRKEVVTEQQRIDVPVTREEVVIERHAVTGDAATAGGAIGDLRPGEEIRVPIMEEQVRVEKTQHVKEELTVGKRKVQETRHIQDTVRHEEARVEGLGDAHRTTGDQEPWRGSERRFEMDSAYPGPERRRMTHAYR